MATSTTAIIAVADALAHGVVVELDNATKRGTFQHNGKVYEYGARIIARGVTYARYSRGINVTETTDGTVTRFVTAS